MLSVGLVYLGHRLLECLGLNQETLTIQNQLHYDIYLFSYAIYSNSFMMMFMYIS